MADREPKEVECGGAVYLVGGIAPRKCFHILRRLSPFLGHLAPVMKDMFGDEVKKKVAGEESGEEPAPPTAEEKDRMFEAGLSAIPVFTDVLAEMKDEAADYVLDGLLAGVQVKLGQGQIGVTENGKLKATKMPMEVQLELAGRVFVFNFERFFAALPSGFQGDLLRVGDKLRGSLFQTAKDGSQDQSSEAA